jgi:hypothetical protein
VHLISNDPLPAHCCLGDVGADSLVPLYLAVKGVLERYQSNADRKPLCDFRFMVAVDGSRLSFSACDFSFELLQHGRLVMVHISDESKANVPQCLQPAYIKMEMEMRAMQNGITAKDFLPHFAQASSRDDEPKVQVIELDGFTMLLALFTIYFLLIIPDFN